MINDPELCTVIEAEAYKVVPLPPLCASYFTGTKAKPAELIIHERGENLSRPYAVYCVGGKREARQFAAKHNAVCWNF